MKGALDCSAQVAKVLGVAKRPQHRRLREPAPKDKEHTGGEKKPGKTGSLQSEGTPTRKCLPIGQRPKRGGSPLVLL